MRTCRLSKEDNLALARNYLTKSIYSCARMAYINITPDELKAVLDDIDVSRISDEHKKIIKNLNRAWQYALDNLDSEINLDLICKINAIILDGCEDVQGGVLRTKVNHKNMPPPDPQKTIEDLKNISKIEDPLEQALECFLYGGCKNRLFWLGNKRAFLIAANIILIRGGAGLLIIQDKDLVDFNLKSLYYFNTDKKDPLKEFLVENCLITQ
ncbi:MAG: Fic family protein [Clostridiales bacterium]|nr:Fic family protein [Clostridiales bacterium]